MIDVKTYNKSASVLIETEKELMEILEFFQEEGLRWRTGQMPLDPEAVERPLLRLEFGSIFLHFVEITTQMTKRDLTYSGMTYGERVFCVKEVLPQKNVQTDELAVMESKRFCKQEKRVVASYYGVSVLSVERSGNDSAALDYLNIYYDKDKALEEAHALSSRKGVIQVIAKRWNLYSDGTEEPCEHLFSWSENMKG